MFGQYPYPGTGGGVPYPYYQVVPPQPSPVPPQVMVAFRLLDSLDQKQHPLVAVNDISIEEIGRKPLLPVEEKARAIALELLMVYMRSILQ